MSPVGLVRRSELALLRLACSLREQPLCDHGEQMANIYEDPGSAVSHRREDSV